MGEWTIIDVLLQHFGYLYTSPDWGPDERSAEGWDQKEKELRKLFERVLLPVIPNIWGIWNAETKGWIQFDNGQLFWTTSYAVARLQLENSRKQTDRPHSFVRAFPTA